MSNEPQFVKVIYQSNEKYDSAIRDLDNSMDKRVRDAEIKQHMINLDTDESLRKAANIINRLNIAVVNSKKRAKIKLIYTIIEIAFWIPIVFTLIIPGKINQNIINTLLAGIILFDMSINLAMFITSDLEEQEENNGR